MWQLKHYNSDVWQVVAEHSTKLACHVDAVERGFVKISRGRRYMQPDVLIVELETE